jgi:hypothetical protein
MIQVRWRTNSFPNRFLNLKENANRQSLQQPKTSNPKQTPLEENALAMLVADAF